MLTLAIILAVLIFAISRFLGDRVSHSEPRPGRSYGRAPWHPSSGIIVLALLIALAFLKPSKEPGPDGSLGQDAPAVAVGPEVGDLSR